MTIEREPFIDPAELKWPKVGDAKLSELEIVQDHSLYLAILKPKRTSKFGRDLYQNTPITPEIVQKFGEFRWQYTVDLEPGQIAGNHYHEKKTEIFCPHGAMDLFLKDIKTGQKIKLYLDRGPKNTYIQYLIPPEVAHTVHNPSDDIVTYTVLSTVKEKEAIESGDIKEFAVLPFPPQ